MTNSFNIVTRFYRILNVEDITSIIDGNIYKFKKPVDRKAQDIVIGMLTNPADRLQNGWVNINCYCIETALKTPDTETLDVITNAVLSVLSDNHQQEMYFHVESQNVFQDNECPEMYYSNIKINFQIH